MSAQIDRRFFLGAGLVTACGASVAAAQTEPLLGVTAVPLPAPGLPLGPLPGAHYPDPHRRDPRQAVPRSGRRSGG